MNRKNFTFALLLLVLLAVGSIPRQAEAIPAFARQHKISCTTCHAPFPRLKDFGEEFAGSHGDFQYSERVFLRVFPCALADKAHTPGDQFGRQAHLRAGIAAQQQRRDVCQECWLGEGIGKAVRELPGVGETRAVAYLARAIDDGYVTAKL